MKEKKKKKGKDKGYVVGLGTCIVTWKNQNGQSKPAFISLMQCIQNAETMVDGSENKVGYLAIAKDFFSPRK